MGDRREDIYRLSSASGRPERVTYGSSDYANGFPARSPVDDRVAFVRQRRSGVDSLFLLAPDAEGTRPLSAPNRYDLSPPAWSPDGRSLLISAGDDPPSRRLFVVHVDGSPATELPLPGGTFDCGTFSTNGDRIVASRSISGTSQVVVIDVSTTAMDVLIESDSVRFHCPEWSRASDVIGVTSYSLDYNRTGLGLIDLATGLLQGLDAGPGYNNTKNLAGQELADEAVRFDPDSAAAYAARAVTRAQAVQLFGAPRELLRGAIDDVDRALTLAPHLPEAHFSHGLVLQTSGRLRAAIRPFRRATLLSDGQRTYPMRTQSCRASSVSSMGVS